MALVFVDCEAWGGCPRTGQLTEFGAVDYDDNRTFHGVIVKSNPDPKNPAVPIPTGPVNLEHERTVYQEFAYWLGKCRGRPVFVSDNNGYDYQWINDGFWRHIGSNPFGHSSRRISDYYAGLMGNFFVKLNWKKFRVTPHDHNPVHDALGNVEAFRQLQQGKC